MFDLSSDQGVFPAQPSRLTASLIVGVGERVHDRLIREIDPRLAPEPAWFAEVDGSLTIDQKGLTRTAERWGVPVGWIAGVAGSRAQPIRRPRTISAVRLLFTRLSRPRRALRDAQRLMLSTCEPYGSFAAAITAAETLYAEFLGLHLELRAARAILESLAGFIGIPDFVVRRATVDDEQLKAHARRLLYMSAGDDAEATAALTEGRLPELVLWGDMWPVLLDRYGFHADDELDLAVPRYLEAPERLIAALNAAKEPVRRPGASGRLIAAGLARVPPVRWLRWTSRAQMEARFRLLFAFAHVRFELLRLADRAVELGRLARREALWSLSAEEARMLDGEG